MEPAAHATHVGPGVARRDAHNEQRRAAREAREAEADAPCTGRRTPRGVGAARRGARHTQHQRSVTCVRVLHRSRKHASSKKKKPKKLKLLGKV